ncbi:MAG: hypothetical protein HFG13_09530 [Oscillibacter sp.]|nr:hypothetical protein [Oscillibacter sp.]
MSFSFINVYHPFVFFIICAILEHFTMKVKEMASGFKKRLRISAALAGRSLLLFLDWGRLPWKHEAGFTRSGIHIRRGEGRHENQSAGAADRSGNDPAAAGGAGPRLRQNHYFH